jgi:hypothetical protein
VCEQPYDSDINHPGGSGPSADTNRKQVSSAIHATQACRYHRGALPIAELQMALSLAAVLPLAALEG